MRYLLATDSVHTTTAACDYLDSRLESGDAVDVLTVLKPTGAGDDSGVTGAPGSAAPGSTAAEHDAADAANVASVRLAGQATVETFTREGDPAAVVRSVAAERDAEVVLLGIHGGRSGARVGHHRGARRGRSAGRRPAGRAVTRQDGWNRSSDRIPFEVPRNPFFHTY